MNVQFKVHGVAQAFADVQTEVDGEPINTSAKCLEVELVTTSPRHGNLTLRFIGSSMADATELFKQDAVINVSFEGEADKTTAAASIPRSTTATRAPAPVV